MPKRSVTREFPLADFHRHVQQFAFIAGYQQHLFQEQDPINIEAVQIMGQLHDTLEAGGYSGHDLERFLVRVLFCLFAEDTGIFERESFRLFIENRTAPDGSDLGHGLARLFEVLNTTPVKRQKNLDETLVEFPYVNDDLFSEHLGFADFNRDMRNALLACTRMDWSRISPAIFGSLFQSIMDDKKRREIGAHYTGERDILKLVRSLFLDELRAEFQTRKVDRSTGRRARLEEFHAKICRLRFLDPACGCGNFLVIGYRELRQPKKRFLAIPKTSSERRKIHTHRLSAAGNHCGLGNLFLRGRGAVSLRYFVLNHAHGLGAPSVRTIEIGLPIFKQSGVQQFPMAGRHHRQTRACGGKSAGRSRGAGAATLADIYDPLRMPALLVRAHAELDRAVEQCYRSEPFRSDRERVEFLFSLYEKLAAPLLPVTPSSRTRRLQSRQRP
jgi:hypothetical protein